VIERPDAGALMAGPLGTWLAGQNAARSEAKEKSRKYTFYGIVGAIFLGTFTLVFSHSAQATVIVGGIAFAIGAGLAQMARKTVTDRIKSEMNQAIAEALGLEYSARVTPGKTFERAKAFDLVPSHDDDNFEDLWWGVLGTQPFTLHEAKLTEERGSGKNRRTVTVFAGSIMTVGFNRNFIGTTLIERKSNHRGFFGGLKEQITLDGIELKLVDMVDPRFEEAFAVWSDDGVEARYLVHPDYAERLTAVEQAYSGNNIRALFREGELLIVLESGDMFESGSLDAEDDRAMLERTIGQFTSLAELATKLNERPRAGFN
jgi:hypothetical protein